MNCANAKRKNFKLQKFSYINVPFLHIHVILSHEDIVHTKINLSVLLASCNSSLIPRLMRMRLSQIENSQLIRYKQLTSRVTTSCRCSHRFESTSLKGSPVTLLLRCSTMERCSTCRLASLR